MTRQRMSREQSREQTRERLVDASHAVFTQKGFALASVEDIAAAAGYTRGAFYSNFDDKTELFFELLRRESAATDLEFHRMLAEPLADPLEVQHKIAAYYSTLYRDDMCSVLWMEAKIVAARDEKFRAVLNVFFKERHDQIAQFVEIFSSLTGIPPAAPSQQIAIGLMALCEGVAFAHRSDPQRIDHKTAEAVLSWFLKMTMMMPAAPTQQAASAAKLVARQKTPTKTLTTAPAKTRVKRATPKPGKQ